MIIEDTLLFHFGFICLLRWAFCRPIITNKFLPISFSLVYSHSGTRCARIITPVCAMDDGESTSHSRRRASEEDLRMTGRRSRSHRRRLSVSSRNAEWNEQSSLLESSGRRRDYSTVPSTPRPRISRHHSTTSQLDTRPSRIPSFTQRLTRALSNYDLKNKTTESLLEERVWYDQVRTILSPYEAHGGVLTYLNKSVYVYWYILLTTLLRFYV